MYHKRFFQPKNYRDVIDRKYFDFKIIDFTLALTIRVKDLGTNRLLNVKRGLWKTQRNAHLVDLNGWGPITHGSVPSSRRYVEDGRLLMRSQADYAGFYASVRGAGKDAYKQYGTLIEFTRPRLNEGGLWHTMAGMVVNLQSDHKSGYYFELVAEPFASTHGYGNVRCFKIQGGNRIGLPATDEGKVGYYYNINVQSLYQMDVVVNKDTNTFSLYINGMFITSFTDSTYTSGLWGMYTRGNTEATFEYFYAVNPSKTPTIEESQIFNRVLSDYISGYVARERSAPTHSTWFFDEFAPRVHEIREFNVDHSVYPALDSYILLQNPWEAVAYGKSSDPFNTKFYVENASRSTAVLNGEEIINSRTQPLHFLVYGQVLVRKEERKVNAKSIDSMRRFGTVGFSLQNPWVQTEDQARRLADHIRDRWALPIDVVEAEIVPDIALQPGDLVSVYYPSFGYTGVPASNSYDYQYYVTEILTDYSDGGLAGSVTLRRKR